MSGVGSKSRSPGLFLENSCLHSRGHNFSPIFFKPGQNNYNDDISIKFAHGWGQVRKYVTWSNLWKIFITLKGPQIQPKRPQTWSDWLNLWHFDQQRTLKGQGKKSRSLCQILRNFCIYSQGNTLSPIFLKLGQNDNTDDFLIEL